MRGRALLAVSLVAATSRVAGHPICYDDTPPDVDTGGGYFCPPQTSGTCCTDLDDMEIENTFLGIAGDISVECAGYFKEVRVGYGSIRLNVYSFSPIRTHGD